MVAELLLKIGDGSNYEDGDVLCAFNRRRTRCCHAWHLCHPRHEPVNLHGFRPLDCLAERFMREVHKHRIEQTGKYTARVTVQPGWSLDDGEVAEREVTGPEFAVTIGSNPIRTVRYSELARKRKTLQRAVWVAATDYSGGAAVGQVTFAGGQSKNTWMGTVMIGSTPVSFSMTLLSPITMHVDEFFDARLKHVDAQGNPKHVVFGNAPERAVYYTGRQDYSNSRLDTVWTEIAAKTGRLESEDEFRVWPAGQQELKSHLMIPVVEFSDVEAEALVAPWTEPAPTSEDPEAIGMVKKRMVRANWKSTLAALRITEADVLDRAKMVDVRREPPIADVALLWHKRDNRPAKRIT